MKHSGFTLIELLIVIAIIAILAAILFPVFATAREKARQSACASNEKQLGLALHLYTEDYDETMIPAGAYNKSWIDFLMPYISNANANASGILICPSALDSDAYCTYQGQAPPCTTNVSRTTNRLATYAVNAICWYDATHTLYCTPPAMLAQFDMPADTIFAGDSKYVGASAYQVIGTAAFNTSVNPPTLGYPGQDGAFVFRHSGGANFIFMDGHVKWMAIQTLTKAIPSNTSFMWYFSRLHS